MGAWRVRGLDPGQTSGRDHGRGRGRDALGGRRYGLHSYVWRPRFHHEHFHMDSHRRKDLNDADRLPASCATPDLQLRPPQ